MPSKKPQFVIRTEQEIIDKLQFIAAENERSGTQEIVFLIKQHIKKYETEHGKISAEAIEKMKYNINNKKNEPQININQINNGVQNAQIQTQINNN